MQKDGKQKYVKVFILWLNNGPCSDSLYWGLDTNALPEKLSLQAVIIGFHRRNIGGARFPHVYGNPVTTLSQS